MKKRFTAITAVLIITIVLAAGFLVTRDTTPRKPADAYVGITYCGDTVQGGKALIDKVKDYTNLFLLNSGTLQRDLDSVTELGDYAIAKGMYFIPYFGNYIQSTLSPWLDNAKQRWGDHFLGVYYADEPAGKMLDSYVEFKDQATGNTIQKTPYGDLFVTQPNGVKINYQIEGPIVLYEPSVDGEANYEEAFYKNGTITATNPNPNGFSYHSYNQLQSIRPFKDVNETYQRFVDRDSTNIAFLKSKTTILTTDYDLYWYDYKMGYDVMLTQLGWNLSTTWQIAQLRGAATLQNKDWGVIITWKTQTAPYLDSGAEIFNQMKTAYQCGANYVVVFDYYDSSSGEFGSMQEEHFKAVKTFWDKIVTNANEVKGSIQADAAVVFPYNYALGGRWAEDNVWGIYKADTRTIQMWTTMQTALQAHGLKLDIVYDDPACPLQTKNQTVYNMTDIG
jgi:hypothetical protein